MDRRRPLLSLQALRAAAAAAVVIYHLVHAEAVYGGGLQILGGLAQFGFAGVDAFFAISGFIMATVTAGRFGSVTGAVDFAAKRVIRIYPLYWVCTAAILIVITLRPGMLDPALQDKSIWRSLLLVPQLGGPHLIVGWTLTFELFFYAMTALALAFCPERRVPHLLCAWALVLAVLQTVPDTGPWVELVTSPLAFEFIAGAVAGLTWHQLRGNAPTLCLALGVVIMLVACWLLLDAPNRGQSPGIRTLAFGLPAALVVAGLAALEAAGRLRVPSFAVALGDASYSLYLTHVFVLSLCGRVWAVLGGAGTLLGNAAFLVGSFVACCLVALAAYHLLERPLLRAGHSAVARWEARPA